MAVNGPSKPKKSKKKSQSHAPAGRRPSVLPPRSTFPASMDPDLARMAGMGSLALGVIAAVLLIVYAGIHYNMPPAQMGGFAACVLVAVGACALGVLLLKGAAVAHYVLLWFWLALTGAATVFGLTAALWQAPSWWDKAIPLAAVVGPIVGLGAVISVLMALVSKSGTRLRYGTMVTVSLVAAVTVVATVNVIAHRDPVHKDFQALGVYGVSERTETVLKGVDQPLRLTCVYTSTEKDKLGSEYRPRVTELLEEIRAKMRSLGKSAEITNVTTDSQKAEVIDRLQQKLREQAGGQVKLLKDFQPAADELVAMLARQQQDWAKLPKDSYLSQWELPERVRGMLRSKTEKIQELGKKIQDQMGSSRVVDYSSLVSDVKKGIEDLQRDLKDAAGVMKRRGEIHKEAKKNRKSALEGLAKFDKAIAAVAATLSEESAKKDPKAALSNFAKSAAKAADQAKDVARALEDIAGSGNADHLAAAECWQVPLRTTMGVARAPVSELYAISGEQLAELATNAQGMVQVLTPDAQAKQIAFMRQRLGRVKALLDAGGKAARQGADVLTTVDKATQAVLDRAEKDELFKGSLDKLKELLQRIEDLPKVESKALPRDLTDDNIVIVEVGDNFEVASFEEVWPLRDRNRGMREPADDEEKRIFNGDSAIASKVLSVTRKQKPFATVYLTYLAPFDRDTAMQMMRMAMQMRMGMGPPPNAAINPGMLSTLRQRLTEANFEVKEWDLAEPLEIPKDATRPQVLVVLPASTVSMRNQMTAMMMQQFQSQMRQFGQVHADRLKAAVDAGVPAVFLTGSAWSAYQPRFTQIVDYLKKDWGVEVKRDYRVLAGVPDPDQPGMYKVDILSINYLPLSTFSDHPIGKPLQGQRMLWTEVAPLGVAENDAGKKEPPQGVRHQSLLSVTEDRTDVWAPKEINRLFDAIRAQQTGLIKAGAGDITAPFDLAVVAERKAAAAERPDATELAVTDVKNWKALRDAVVNASKDPAFPPRPGMPAPDPKPAKRVWELLDKNVQTHLESAEDITKLTLAMKKDVIDSLNKMLKDPTFFKRSGKRPPMPTRPGMPPMPTPKEPFDAVALPREAVELHNRQQKAEKGDRDDGEDDDKGDAKPAKPAQPLSEPEQMRLNRLVMEAALPKVFAESRAAKPARIVVLGMGPSFFDGYMNEGVPRLTGKGFSFDPPPRADADLIVSSVYWLSGNKEYIAAGPAIVKPVNVSRWARIALGALCVIGLPLVVLAAGGGVMIMRRRG